jgi:hypothetical protein
MTMYAPQASLSLPSEATLPLHSPALPTHATFSLY